MPWRLLDFFGKHKEYFRRDKAYFQLGEDLFILFNLTREIGFIGSESFKRFSEIGQVSLGYMDIYEY